MCTLYCVRKPEEITKLILDFMYLVRSGRGRSVSFAFGEVGAPHWARRFATEFHIDETKAVIASLELRASGPSYLRKLPLDSTRSLLVDFMTEHYSIIADEVLFNEFSESFLSVVSESSIKRLTLALSESTIFHPDKFLSLFPLVPIKVFDDFESDTFLLLGDKTLSSRHLGDSFRGMSLNPAQFPPDSNWEHRKWTVSAWLGVYSPAKEAAERLKAAVLGALALAPASRNRYVCSMRSTFGGVCSFNNGTISVTPSESPSMPPLMDDIHVTQADHRWLEILASKLDSENKSDQREVKALEYFYRAWFQETPDRYPILYMALDSVFGDAGSATKSVIEGVRELLGEQVSYSRLRDLSDLRSAVIHGGAPEIYDSKKYAKYYRNHNDDPITDLGLVTAECLRRKLFGEHLKEHRDRNREFIEDAISKGLAPAYKSSTILTG